MKQFVYDGVSCEAIGLRYLTTVQPILPTLSRQVQTIPGRPGEYFFGSTIAAKQIQISVSIVRNTLVDLNTQIHNIAAWLLPTDQPRPLVLPDEPDKTYYAVLDGDTALSVLAAMGSATLTFVCTDPFAYGATESQALATGNNTLEITGTASVYPIITATMTAAASELKVTHVETGDFILINNYSFKAGDVVVIDLVKQLVTINGERAMPYLDIASRPVQFLLPPGVQTLDVEPAGVATVNVSWTPRWW